VADALVPASGWHPTLGARPEKDGTRFRVWAPAKQRVEVVVEAGGVHPLTKAADGTFSGFIPRVGAGDRYRYRLDDEGPYPDPASRFQPEGVHGPSQVVDPARFTWSDAAWHGVRLEDLILYELHVGTFTRAGTFAGVREHLPELRDLGVTAIELMPLADFPGQRNWGYDGVCLFAPARCYGNPDDLRRLVDAAHRVGLAVHLDVVYNHLGPDGAYLGTFSPYYFSRRHRTPWGDAINLDGEHSAMVRSFLIENALHWVHEYHIDGLRLDATHALFDDGPRHFLAELASRVRVSVAGRRVLVIAEDHRNLAQMLRPEAEGGWGLDAVWADDFHHQVRRHLTGDCEGYYRDYSGSAADVSRTVRKGWFFCGQHSVHLNGPRGTDPNGLTPRQFVVCLQNHDQVGNRAFGERLHHQIDLAAYRAVTVLLLCAPETPLLFMGQEWATASRFLFFTDHGPELGSRVTEGRRREFRSFSAFANPKVRERIPDPQAADTFRASRLRWSEPKQEPHASILRLYRALIELRRREPALRRADWNGFDATAVADSVVTLRRVVPNAASLLTVVRTRGSGAVTVDIPGPAESWQVLVSSEDASFAPDPMPIRSEPAGGGVTIHFARPGAVVLKAAAA
jgi:maltooligosyltrehalose trehalohydrolase